MAYGRKGRPEPYPWLRRDTETDPAWEAFQTYLRLGKDRSIAKAAAKVGKTPQCLEVWSVRHQWVDRVTAHDNYVMLADTEDLAFQMTESRDENLELVRKLRGHLSARLDEFIDKNQDPTIRWNQALTAMAKLEANAFLIKDDAKTAERVTRIEELVERALSLDTGVE